MAFVRKSIEQIRAEKPDLDSAKLASTTENDIRQHKIEDGEDPDASLAGFEWKVPARAARARLQMTQESMAELLRIPVATLRNWEQGRVTPDPAAQALLTIIYRNPAMARNALCQGAGSPRDSVA